MNAVSSSEEASLLKMNVASRRCLLRKPYIKVAGLSAKTALDRPVLHFYTVIERIIGKSLPGSMRRKGFTPLSVADAAFRPVNDE